MSFTFYVNKEAAIIPVSLICVFYFGKIVLQQVTFKGLHFKYILTTIFVIFISLFIRK